jgi:hypothetical protein
MEWDASVQHGGKLASKDGQLLQTNFGRAIGRMKRLYLGDELFHWSCHNLSFLAPLVDSRNILAISWQYFCYLGERRSYLEPEKF